MSGQESEQPRRFPEGVDLVAKGKCPLKCEVMMACVVCSYGHFLECHYPQTCKEANCSHYQREGDPLA
jgi:hypothetical protein